MLEIGDVYNTYYKFNNIGEATYIRRFNRAIHSSYSKNVIGKDSKIWIINYNGKKSIGFKIDKNKLK